MWLGVHGLGVDSSGACGGGGGNSPTGMLTCSIEGPFTRLPATSVIPPAPRTARKRKLNNFGQGGRYKIGHKLPTPAYM